MCKATTKAKPSSQAKKKSNSAVGAPSQLSQSTGKGKNARRKHIDVDNVEEDLESFGQKTVPLEWRCTTSQIKTCSLLIPLVMGKVP